MNAIDKKLQEIEEQNRLWLMTHWVWGYPSLQESQLMIETMDRAGVDFIEIQIPFSDPVADGPIITSACQQSLENWTSVQSCFELMSTVSKKVNCAMLFMAYLNTIYTIWLRDFCKNASDAWASWLIIPDFPLHYEARLPLAQTAKEFNLKLIKVFSPLSENDYVSKHTTKDDGFIYFTSRQWTTGTGTNFDSNVFTKTRALASITWLPVAVWFWIKSDADIQLLKKNETSIGIIWSKLIEVYRESWIAWVDLFLQNILLSSKK